MAAAWLGIPARQETPLQAYVPPISPKEVAALQRSVALLEQRVVGLEEVIQQLTALVRGGVSKGRECAI